MAAAGPNPYAQQTVLSPAAALHEVGDPFVWSPKPVEVVAGSTGELTLHLEIPETCEIYRDRLSVRVLDAPGLEAGEAVIPDATHTKTFDEHEYGTLRDNAQIKVPFTAVGDLTGVQVVKLELTHQGCRGGLCYPEVVQQREALVRIVPTTHD